MEMIHEWIDDLLDRAAYKLERKYNIEKRIEKLESKIEVEPNRIWSIAYSMAGVWVASVAVICFLIWLF